MNSRDSSTTIEVMEVNDFEGFLGRKNNIANMERQSPVTEVFESVFVKPQQEKRVFRLLREAKERIKNMMFELNTWNVLWHVNGKNDAVMIAKNLDLNVEEVNYHLDTLRVMGVICPVNAVSLPNFISAKTTKNTKSYKRRSVDHIKPEVKEEPIVQKQEQQKSVKHQFNLRELIDLMLKEKGAGHSAKMAVYLMMASMPRDLLVQDGIRSFKYLDEDIYVTNPELIASLVKHASKMIGYDVKKVLKQDLRFLDEATAETVNAA